MADPFRRPIEPSRFILDDVNIWVEKVAFPMKDQAEVIIVAMPYRRAEAQDSGETSRRPVSRRFIGADHRKSHAWIEPTRRGGRLGLRGQCFAVSQRNID